MNGGAPDAAPAGRLDVIGVLDRAFRAVLANFGVLALAGLLLIVLPSLLGRGFAGDAATLAITLRAALAMLYVALLGWSATAHLSGRMARPRALLREGLARAQPGVQTALLIGAVIVIGLTLHLFARHGTVMGWLLDVLLMTGGLWSLCVLMPVIPVAIVERRGPLAAMRRAAALTEGNRNRILALALVAGLTLVPSGLLVSMVAGVAGWGLQALFELMAWSLVAVLPAAVYIGLEPVK